MKELISKNKLKIVKGIGAIAFFVIIIYVFLSLTYLFRGNQYDYDDRISVVGIKEEKENSLDVIYIGGSAAFVYWEPLHAYKDCGFTSYDLATNTIQAESILAYVKYAQKYQNPNLYVIGVRSFQYYDDVSEIGLRVSSDALDVGINRSLLINNFLNNRAIDTDAIALHIDIAKYHTNYDALNNSTAWKLMDNSMQCDNKGGYIKPNWCYLEEPQNVKNDERYELSENNEKTLIELLDYLKENNLNALFVVCPYSITYEDYSKYNTIGDLVSEYGYEFINTNDYYDEIGIDFSTDFYNSAHVNSLGSEKYTDFLENYLLQNYELPDHRGDNEYSEWQILAESYMNEAEESRAEVRNLIDNANETVQISEEIRKTNDFMDWAVLVNDKRFTIISAGNCSFDEADLKPQFAKAMDQLNLSDIYGLSNFIKITCAADIVASSTDGSTSISENIGQLMTSCIVDNSDSLAKIYIDNTNYSCGKDGYVNMVVFDNYYRTVADTVYLSIEDGTIRVNRL